MVTDNQKYEFIARICSDVRLHYSSGSQVWRFLDDLFNRGIITEDMRDFGFNSLYRNG